GQVVRIVDKPEELFKEVDVKPAVNFSKLEEVLIILHRKISFDS
ncbi:MAG: rod shape-determining protein MreC, partial [Deltaproteobacteria bacterium]